MKKKVSTFVNIHFSGKLYGAGLDHVSHYTGAAAGPKTTLETSLDSEEEQSFLVIGGDKRNIALAKVRVVPKIPNMVVPPMYSIIHVFPNP